jgi:hypothetical protein
VTFLFTFSQCVVERKMVYLPPPQLATAARPSYAEAYANILKAHRQSPLTSAASVIILVAPDVDALCAARMLADLFKQDDVMYRIIPVSGVTELERVRDELITVSEVRVVAHARLFDLESRTSCIRSFSSIWARSWTFRLKSGLVASAPTWPFTSSIPLDRRICLVCSAEAKRETG